MLCPWRRYRTQIATSRTTNSPMEAVFVMDEILFDRHGQLLFVLATYASMQLVDEVRIHLA